ncbi:MAG: hypothetical protein ACJ796_13815 [Gemmatimonadaceae bacterium]
MVRFGMTVVALSIVPAMLLAQTDSSRMRGDSSRGRAARQQSSSGSIGRNANGQRLTRDQVGQLQTALQQANCDPGTIDSVMGARTRKAMNCARQNNHITGNNTSDLYRALNLNFTNSDSASGRAGANTRSGTNGNTGTTGARRGTRTRGDSMSGRPMRADSTRRPSTRRDTTRPGR